MKFADKLRKERLNARLTQEELALRIGVTCRTLQNYESGSVYPKKREIYTRLSELFNTDGNYWLTETQDAPGENLQFLVDKVSNFFADDALTEEDMDAFMRIVQGAYWAAKDKSKHSPK